MKIEHLSAPSVYFGLRVDAQGRKAGIEAYAADRYLAKRFGKPKKKQVRQPKPVFITPVALFSSLTPPE